MALKQYEIEEHAQDIPRIDKIRIIKKLEDEEYKIHKEKIENLLKFRKTKDKELNLILVEKISYLNGYEEGINFLKKVL